MIFVTINCFHAFEQFICTCTVEKILDFPCVIVSMNLNDHQCNLTCHVGQAQYDFYLPPAILKNYTCQGLASQPLMSGPAYFYFFLSYLECECKVTATKYVLCKYTYR